LKAYNGTNWGGIMFGFTQENNVINHAIIENAKGDFPVGNHQNTGAIYLHASPKLTVSNTTFKDLQNCTFYALYDDYFENLTVTNITYDNVGAEYCTP
ncbi:MAG TPA: hypothetical protein VKY82_01465, partial [Flavobacterium sp.]|nr:hypothetical protein [Flavobacterium sp.]